MRELQLGAFARLWRDTNPAAVATAMSDNGLSWAQWNFSAIGLPTVSAAISRDTYRQVKEAFDRAGVKLWGLSCTYNLIHPDIEQRTTLQAYALQMIRNAPLLGVEAVTICAGSRDVSGWTFHPDNTTESAWSDMRTGLDPLIEAAGESGVLIGIEPEHGCVIQDTVKARRFLDELGPSAPVGIVLDVWNLASGDSQRNAADVLTEAFSALGGWTTGLHAKDPLGAKFSQPTLDYDLIARLHRVFTPNRPVIIQDVDVDRIPEVSAYLRASWQRAAQQQELAEQGGLR